MAQGTKAGPREMALLFYGLRLPRVRADAKAWLLGLAGIRQAPDANVDESELMTFLELQTELLERLGDDIAADANAQHYTVREAQNWLNAAQRLFVLMTLCLETTVTLTIAGNSAVTRRMLTVYADWLVPLRVRISGSAKLKPSRLADLAALDNSWTDHPGSLTRYCHSGFDLLSLYKQPTADTDLSITYARGPSRMALDADTPEIPVRFHPALVDAAIPLAKVKEGGSEWQQNLPQWTRFMDAVEEQAGIVRARSRELGYDAMPPELERFDMSRLMKKAS